AVAVERDADEERRVARLRGVGARQVELEARRHQRRGDHEDDEQHQHDVDQRRHVDVAHRLRAGVALEAAERHGQAAGPVATIISRRSCAKPSSSASLAATRLPNTLYASTAGIATARPAAVMTSDSPTGPETRSIVIVPAAEMLTSAW